MTLRNRIGLGLAAWFFLEVAAFAVVVSQIGLGAAILLGIFTSLVGASLLKRVGTSALGRLRREAGRGGTSVFAGDLALDDTLAAFGALLLILPGFVSDVVGLLLSIDVARGLIARRARGVAGAREPGPAHGPAMIDLDPDEWRPVDEPAPRPGPRG